MADPKVPAQSVSVKDRVSAFEKKTDLDKLKSTVSVALGELGYDKEAQSKIMSDINKAKTHEEAQKQTLSLVADVMEKNDSATIKKFVTAFNSEAQKNGIGKFNEYADGFNAPTHTPTLSQEKASKMRSTLSSAPKVSPPVIIAKEGKEQQTGRS